MQTLELVNAVRRQGGDETGSLIEVADVLRWINEGQFQIARRTGDLLGTNTIPVLVGDNRYPLPADFFKSQIAEIDGKRLQLVSEAQLRTLYPDLGVTTPSQGVSKFYSIVNGGSAGAEILLAPHPGQAGSLVITYKSRPPLINATTDDLTIAEEYHTTLLTYCLAKAKQLDGDDQGFAILDTAFNNEVTDDAHDARIKDDETYPFIRASMGDM